MKYQMNLTILDNDDVSVEIANPGEVNPLFIIGLLEKLKHEYISTLNAEIQTEEEQ